MNGGKIVKNVPVYELLRVREHFLHPGGWGVKQFECFGGENVEIQLWYIFTSTSFYVKWEQLNHLKPRDKQTQINIYIGSSLLFL